MNKCLNCSSETTAEIKQLKENGYKVDRPVFYCEKCSLSTQVKKEDKYLWVDSFEWLPPSLFYGYSMSNFLCRGCEKSGVMYADLGELVGSDFSYYHSEYMPVFICYQCGFETRCLEKDKYLWSRAYHHWL